MVRVVGESNPRKILDSTRGTETSLRSKRRLQRPDLIWVEKNEVFLMKFSRFS